MPIDVSTVTSWGDMVQALLLAYAPKLFFAIVVLVVGWIAINFAVGGLTKLFQKTDFDEALEKFIASLANIGLRVILLVTVAGIAGVETTSLVALLGAAGLAVGLALQGSLANFAGGVLILVFKPFKMGDYIAAQGVEGKVHKIEIFSTTLNTLGNQKVVIPNGALANGVITNHTGRQTRRAELQIGIGYQCSVDQARQIALATIVTDERVLRDPVPQVLLLELGDSAQLIEVRFWLETKNILVKYEILERIKEAFDREGIEIPFPQRVVHMVPPPRPAKKAASRKSKESV